MLKKGEKVYLKVNVGQWIKDMDGVPIVFDTIVGSQVDVYVDSCMIETTEEISRQIDYISAIRFLATIGNGCDKLALKGNDLMTALTWDYDIFCETFDLSEVKDRICGCILVNGSSAYIIVGVVDGHIIRINMDKDHRLTMLSGTDYTIENLYDIFCGPRSRYIGKRYCNLSDMLMALRDTVDKLSRGDL